MVWKLDRLGRSLRHLIETVTALRDRGVGFQSLQEAIDTTTSGGKLIFHVFGALAEFKCARWSDDTDASSTRLGARRCGRTNGTSLGANHYRNWTCEHRLFLLLGLDSRGRHLKPYVSRLVTLIIM